MRFNPEELRMKIGTLKKGTKNSGLTKGNAVYRPFLFLPWIAERRRLFFVQGGFKWHYSSAITEKIIFPPEIFNLLIAVSLV